jgi:CheY-like chemotaxis protein
MKEQFNFIIIDDSKLDCFIADKVIRNAGAEGDIKSFTAAGEALEYIKGNPVAAGVRTVVIVDIQMPVMNGFEFVEAFETLPVEQKKNYIIYMLSSSINENDLNRVQNFPSIKQFINKPLTGNILTTLLDTL